jgi:ABC-2 type transport system ATP-binding protein
VERRRVLDGVSFGVRRGELFGLLGTNGAGKSTILRIVAGLIAPDTGTVRVGGLDASTAALPLRRIVGLCCTHYRSFYYRLSARHNLLRRRSKASGTWRYGFAAVPSKRRR